MYNKKTHASLLSTLTISYFLLLVYASLMPFDFNLATDFKWVFNHAINSWPINPHARLSGSDVVSNLLLYIPLGFLFATRLESKQKSKLRIYIFSLILCSITSLIVEVIQASSLLRTSSITDWIMNTISGGIGSYIGVRYGKEWWYFSCDWIKLRWQSTPLDIITLIFSSLIAADALSPFLPSILLSQVWHSLKTSHYNIVAGFSQHPWHWWLVNHIIVYMVLLILAAHWGTRKIKQSALLPKAIICALFATLLEFSKLFIASRVMNLSNLVAAWAGIFSAMLLLKLWNFHAQRNVKLNLGISVLIGYILYLAWFPFNFQFSVNQLIRSVPSGVELLPFYHYAMGASLEHVRLFLQIVLSAGVLIYLLRLRFTQFDNTQFKISLALLITAIIGILQEGGQLFLPSRTASMTDIYCYMIGGFIGTLLPQLPYKSAIKKSDSSISKGY